MNAFAKGWLGYMTSMFWQSLVVMLGVGLVLLLWRRRAPALRHALLCLILLKFLLPVNLHLITGIGHWAGRLFERQTSSIVGQASQMRQPGMSPGVELLSSTPIPLTTTSHLSLPARPIHWPTMLFIGWSSTAALLLAGLLFHAWYTRRRFAQAHMLFDPQLLEIAEACRHEIRIRRRVPLQVLPGLCGPVLYGLARPRIVVSPENLAQLTPAQWRPVLLHELAHAKRHDLLINSLLLVLQALWFFHPGLWLTGWLIRREREKACDELVLEQMRGAGRDYAASILAVLQDSLPTPFPALGLLGIAEKSSAMKNRFLRILDERRTVRARVGRPGALALLAFAVVLLPLAYSQTGSQALTLAEIEAGIQAHEARIQSVEFDMTIEILPSDQHPEIPAHCKLYEGLCIWDSNFNMTMMGKMQLLDRTIDASGKSTILPAFTEDKSWDHKRIVTVKKEANSTNAFINKGRPRDIWDAFYFYLTPMGGLGYMAVALDPGELTLSKTLAKYGAALTNPPTEVVDGKKTYVVETSFANNPDDPLKGERNLKIRFFICPALQFSPLKIEVLDGTALGRRQTIKYADIGGIVFPTFHKENVWFPSGPKKGLEMTAPKEISYSNVRLNKTVPKPVEIPPGVIVYDGSQGTPSVKEGQTVMPKAEGIETTKALRSSANRH